MKESDKQKMIEYIFAYDNQYFNQNKVYQWQDIQGHFYLVNPTTTIDPRTVTQLTDDQLLKSLKDPNKQLYSNVNYTLKNTPPTVKIDYKSTFEVLLLFWFIFYLVRRFTYFVIKNKRLNEARIKLFEQLKFKNPLIIPSLIIGVCILIVAYLVLNNSNSTSTQEAIATNQKCHDLATKYVDNQKTKHNANPITNEQDYSQPYTYDTLLESYTYNQDLKTCLVQYVVFKYVNTLVTPQASPVPDDEHQSIYVDDVIAGKSIGSFHYTECNSNSNYCPSLVNWSFQLKSWGLISLSVWESLYLQTFDRIPFVRSWLGV